MIGAMIEILILLVVHAAAGIYSSDLKYSKKRTYLIWGMWIALQALVLWYTEFVLTNQTLQFFSGFMLPILGQYTVFIATTRGKLAQRLFTLLTYSLFFCISMALFNMVKGTFPALHSGWYTLIHTVLMLGIVSYFLKYVCPLCRTAAKNMINGWGQLNFVNVVFLLTVILSSVFPVRLNSFSDAGCIAYLFLSISIMVVYPVIFSNINSLSEATDKREVQRQNQLLIAQIEAEKMQLSADRQARHDRRHHHLVMLEFANNNDIESVREYLKSLVESETEVGGQPRYCEHMTVNTVLTVYERRSRESGISVSISAAVSREMNITPQDAVIVIANLFENAINAAAKLKDVDKHIDISIKESAQRLIVSMKNPCKEKMAFDEYHYGVGLRSVISTVGKYDGMYDFTAENGVFSARISLNLR